MKYINKLLINHQFVWDVRYEWNRSLISLLSHFTTTTSIYWMSQGNAMQLTGNASNTCNIAAGRQLYQYFRHYQSTSLGQQAKGNDKFCVLNSTHTDKHEHITKPCPFRNLYLIPEWRHVRNVVKTMCLRHKRQRDWNQKRDHTASCPMARYHIYKHLYVVKSLCFEYKDC
jgi:hypothetical protein